MDFDIVHLHQKFVYAYYYRQKDMIWLMLDYWVTRVCRKTRVQSQTSSEQADAQSRPQVSREMLPIHCNAWTCLSIVTLEYTSLVRFLPNAVNEKKFLSTQ